MRYDIYKQNEYRFGEIERGDNETDNEEVKIEDIDMDDNIEFSYNKESETVEEISEPRNGNRRLVVNASANAEAENGTTQQSS